MKPGTPHPYIITSVSLTAATRTSDDVKGLAVGRVSHPGSSDQCDASPVLGTDADNFNLSVVTGYTNLSSTALSGTCPKCM